MTASSLAMALGDQVGIDQAPFPIHIDQSRDDLLTEFGKKTLENQYLLPGESYQDLFCRVARAFSDDADHGQRMYDYLSQHWVMMATPILANAGSTRGLPISCFLNEAQDSINGIIDMLTENAHLGARGGGIGSYFGNIRAMDERLSNNGRAVGVVPFIKVMESFSLAIDQGSLRRGAGAAYLDVSHPEILEFIDLRKPTGGDHNRRALYLHHGVLIPDAFMKAVQEDLPWDLVSPNTGCVLQTVSAREVWIRLLTTRMETGEPYLVFIDHVNRALPEHQKRLGLRVKMSNLCTEITLPTGLDQHGRQRTAVCCLGSLNLETYMQWKDHPRLIEDVLRFLDNVLSYFIANAPASMNQAIYSASRERSVGMGVMGLHAFFQSQNIPWESATAKAWNRKIFSHIHDQVRRVSKTLADERGACPDAAECGLSERFSNATAIAPTASISIICGGTSPGIEPFVSNAYTHKTLSGSFFVRNKYLERLLQSKGMNTQEVWSCIMQNEGSVQHLGGLTDYEKMVFKTAFELDQRWLVDFAGDRQPHIDQAQSLNLFLASDVHKRVLHDVHMQAHTQGVKSLYYNRSRSIQRPETALTAQNLVQKSMTGPDRLPLSYQAADGESKEGGKGLQLQAGQGILGQGMLGQATGSSSPAGGYDPNAYNECLACQ
jgi:ribonucleoside-diphosphate reductase alpha chain